jgi:flagellar motility protein MotE (MotC chaperone)
MPRLLPITCVVMALLLVVKSAGLVLAETSEPAAAGSRPATAAAPPTAKGDAAKPDTKTGTNSATQKPPRQAGANDPATTAGCTNTGAVMPAPAESVVSDSERALLTDLRQRRLALDARESEMSVRAVTLAAIETRLNTRVQELKGLQSSLEDLEKQRKQRDEANWSGLVKLYETMKPRDAAAIFNDLDMTVLLQVLDRMKEAKSALVLAAMQPERARQVTEGLAQMRAKANTAQPPPDAAHAQGSSG